MKSLSQQLTTNWFFTTSDGRRMFAPRGLVGRPYVVPNLATELRMAKRCAIYFVGMLSIGLLAIPICVAFPDQNQNLPVPIPVPTPQALFGIFGVATLGSEILYFFTIQPILHGRERGTRREFWIAFSTRIVTTQQFLLPVALIFFGLAALLGIGLFVIGAWILGLTFFVYAVVIALICFQAWRFALKHKLDSRPIRMRDRDDEESNYRNR